MSPLDAAMEAYPFVFHPITVLGVGVVVAIYLEWDGQGLDRSTLWRRLAGFLGAGVLALVPTGAYILYTGSGVFQITGGNAWQVDALVAGGVLIAAGGTWWLWRRNDWGGVVPEMMEVLAAVTVPYVLLSPFWNVSGHVMIALVPALFLTVVDRRFWPSLAIPVVMIPNRIYLDAHTWAQSIGGFLMAAVIVLGVHTLRRRRSAAGPALT